MAELTRRHVLSSGTAVFTIGLAGCGGQASSSPTADTASSPSPTAGGTNTPTPDIQDAPFDQQLTAVRSLSEQYAGQTGIENAFADGYRPTGPHRRDPQHWFWFEGSDGQRRADLTVRTFDVLVYIRGGLDDTISLGGVGYGVSISDHDATDHTPPDLFDDEGEDVEPSEQRGWNTGQPDAHAAPEAHTGFRSVFSNHDDAVVDDITDLPRDVVFDENNWAFVENDTWDSEGGFAPGDTYDVDGDGTPEVLDFTFHRRTAWQLVVWVHIDNPRGIFSGTYRPVPAPGSQY